MDTDKELLSPFETARMLGVDVKTIRRWAKAEKIRSLKTPGGHNRYFAEDVYRIRDGDSPR
jgi:putative resolvase